MTAAAARIAGLSLGAPGVYRLPEPPLRALVPERLDVAAFAGIAPRGPARVPLRDEEADGRWWRGDEPCVEPERPRHRTVAVALESFDDYLRSFGGFDGPGRLPYAVAAFFDNGGRRALVARIVHAYGDARDDDAVATTSLGGFTLPCGLRARSEGAWGNGLVATLAFSAAPLALAAIDLSTVELPPGQELPAGTLVRVTLADGARTLRFVQERFDRPDPLAPGWLRRARLDAPLPAPAAAFERIEATLALDDGDGRSERFTGLGLAFGHPRWIALVLCDASTLAWPQADWARGELRPASADLAAPAPARFAGGADRWADVVHDDFFDDAWTPDAGLAGDGIACFATPPVEAASLVVPDLYEPAPLPPIAPAAPLAPGQPQFATCLAWLAPEPTTVAALDLPGLQLDPATQLDAIARQQQRVVDFAESTRQMVALLDVPPGLTPPRVRRWRAAFASSHAAAYLPWLGVARRDDDRDALVDVPPSAVAAGIVARSEWLAGVPRGPANLPALEVVRLAEPVAATLHGEWHGLGLNLFLPTRDAVQLVAARTLAADAAWRQLSVRRLFLLLRRTLELQMAWVPFEPNNAALARELQDRLVAFLRRFWRAGALAGATEAEAFFVRPDRSGHERGELVVEIGVAPAEPLEFIVLRVARDGDGTLTIAE